MNNQGYEKIKKVVSIERLIVGFMVVVILLIAFIQNEGKPRLMVLPFLICGIANFFEMLFYYLKKEKIAKVFNYIFKISFLIFIVNKEYPFLIMILVFVLITYLMLKDKFFKRK